MRVRITEGCRPYWNYALHELEKGQVLAGEFAKYLHLTGGPVEVLEADDEPGPLAPPLDPASEDPPPQGPEGLDIEGTIDTILTWVGGSVERAHQALELEQAKGDKARATLVKRLQVLTDEPQ